MGKVLPKQCLGATSGNTRSIELDRSKPRPVIHIDVGDSRLIPDVGGQAIWGQACVLIIYPNPLLIPPSLWTYFMAVYEHIVIKWSWIMQDNSNFATLLGLVIYVFSLLLWIFSGSLILKDCDQALLNEKKGYAGSLFGLFR